MNDMKLFDRYRKDWTRNNGGDYCSVDHLLRLWDANKSVYLNKLMGGNLILEKQISYDAPKRQIQNDMNDLIEHHCSFLESIVAKLAKLLGFDSDYCYAEETVNQIAWRNIRRALFSCEVLTENKLDLGYDGYDENGAKFIKQITINFDNGKKLQLQRGMKVTRAMTQICKNLGMEEEWEKFRILHSQVLNTKKLTGTLCLSIHPLDYATASDNNNGWCSCMSWQDYGCYRMGTVEMMNSPMVICAYLKSDKQHMSIINDDDWNSKKWRAWIIVTKDVIVCNRHYPYHIETMAVNCINWVRELAKERLGWEYKDPHTDFFDWMQQVDYEIEFRTNYMYNDLGGDDVIGCFKKDWTRRNMPGYINFSGPAECMVCGEEIPPETQDAGQLECNDCYCEFRCSECGEAISDEGDVYYDPDGRCLCRDCWERICATCDICGETMYQDEQIEVCFPVVWKNTDKFSKYFEGRLYSNDGACYSSGFQRFWNNRLDLSDVFICEHCASHYGIKEVEFHFDKYDDNVTLVNPKHIGHDRFLRIFNAPGYDFAAYVLRRLSYGDEYITPNPERAKEYCQAIVDFWEDQVANIEKEFETQN